MALFILSARCIFDPAIQPSLHLADENFTFVYSALGLGILLAIVGLMGFSGAVSLKPCLLTTVS